eukprot:m.28631 g.28631  ORF g.28631 m.28631 type:complete len:411 (-) comp8018_c0_seq1:53-1285(-)
MKFYLGQKLSHVTNGTRTQTLSVIRNLVTSTVSAYSSTAIIRSTSPSVVLEEKELFLKFKNCSQKIPYLWLYDNRPSNWHENGQKLTESRFLPKHIRPRSVALENEDKLCIQWEQSETVRGEEYSLDWLIQKTQFKHSDSIPSRQLWAKLLDVNAHNYQEIATNSTALADCLKDVAVYGFAKVEDVPNTNKQVLDLAAIVGYVRETNYGKFYDVVTKADPENLADSNLGLAPHTDNPYRNPTPGMQILHCLKPDAEGGGATTLVDGLHIVELVRESLGNGAVESLCHYPVSFQFKSKNAMLFNETNLVKRDSKGKAISVKFNNRSIQPFPILPTFYTFLEAYQTMEKLINDEANHTHLQLKSGDAIIMDNERLLHGRTALSSGKASEGRLLQGCYVDRDEVYSRLSRLNC